MGWLEDATEAQVICQDLKGFRQEGLEKEGCRAQSELGEQSTFTSDPGTLSNLVDRVPPS